MTTKTQTKIIPEPNTVIHKRIQGITDAILSLAYEGADKSKTNKGGLVDIANAINNLKLFVTVPAPNISINISVYILLINLNIFIWWWLCRNNQDRIGCLMEQFRQSPLCNKAIEAYDGRSELQEQFKAALELPVGFRSLTAKSLEEQPPLEEGEEEQKWQERAAMIQDLCMEMLGSFAVESSEARQQAAPPPPPPETFPTSEGIEEQLTEETLAQALPLLHKLSQVEASLTQENLDFPNLDRLEKQLEALQTKLAEHTDLFNEELVRSASEPLQDNTPPVRYQRLIELQKLRLLILQYFASNS